MKKTEEDETKRSTFLGKSQSCALNTTKTFSSENEVYKREREF